MDALWAPGGRKGCLISGETNSVIHAENKIGLTHHLIHKNNFKMEINGMKRHSGLFHDNPALSRTPVLHVVADHFRVLWSAATSCPEALPQFQQRGSTRWTFNASTGTDTRSPLLMFPWPEHLTRVKCKISCLWDMNDSYMLHQGQAIGTKR